jgi:hypothetical protein
MFAGHSPPRDQYEFGRGRSFESQRGYIPCFPFCGACTPPTRREVIPHGGHIFDRTRIVPVRCYGQQNINRAIHKAWV